MSAPVYTPRQVLGAALIDAPGIVAGLATADGWVGLKNRHERLSRHERLPGVRCEFRWTSGLHGCSVFPALGRAVMHRAFEGWPVRFEAEGSAPPSPDVSFLIPFRGRDRLSQLCAVVRSILGQTDVRTEVIVVEQDEEPVAREALPPGCRHVHLPHPDGDPGWRKSWAFNVGASAARAPVLVCHDGDIVVPRAYARTALDLLDEGFDSVHAQRFLFYLSEADSARIVAADALRPCRPADVRQNWLGGTLAIRRDVYYEIGGFDEGFVDWGGEDNEFFDRCAAVRQFAWGFVPFVHLWHPPQATKSGPARMKGVSRMEARQGIDARERIAELAAALARDRALHARLAEAGER